MKRLLPLLMISLTMLVGCETYCERNFPSETIPMDPLPEPSLSDVGYPEGPGEMLEVFRRMDLPEDDPSYISDIRAVATILADYAEPLRLLVDLHKDRFNDLLQQADPDNPMIKEGEDAGSLLD